MIGRIRHQLMIRRRWLMCASLSDLRCPLHVASLHPWRPGKLVRWSSNKFCATRAETRAPSRLRGTARSICIAMLLTESLDLAFESRSLSEQDSGAISCGPLDGSVDGHQHDHSSVLVLESPSNFTKCLIARRHLHLPRSMSILPNPISPQQDAKCRNPAIIAPDRCPTLIAQPIDVDGLPTPMVLTEEPPARMHIPY